MKNNFEKIVSYLVVLLPILGTYGFFLKSVTFADVAICIILFFAVLKSTKKKTNKYDKNYIIFVVWGIISTVFSLVMFDNISSTNTLIQLIKFILYSFMIILIPKNYFDIVLAKKIYSNVVIVISIIVFIQYFLYLITGNFYPWVLNSKIFPPIYVNDDYFTTSYLYMLGGSSYRPSSIFSEPALFAQYVSPCLIMNLFSKRTKNKYLTVFLITMSVILGKSANGIIYIAVIWFVYLISRLFSFFKNKDFKVKLSTIIVIFVLIIFYPFIFPKLNELLFGAGSSSLYNRLLEISDYTGNSSGSMRVMRGWMIFDGMAFIEKANGIGIGNILDFLDLNPSLVPMFKKAYNGYMSGLSAIFVNFGIIGGILYLNWWFKQYINKGSQQKGFLLFLLLYLIASNSFYTPHFVFTTILIIAHNKCKNNINLERKI